MSKLNDKIKPWLLANGFEEITGLPSGTSDYEWDYRYSNGYYCIYFDELHNRINSVFIHSGIPQSLDGATGEYVVAHFAKYGKTPTQKEYQTIAPNTATTTQQADCKPQTGWQCPCCGMCHAPWVSSCSCRGYNGAGGGIPSAGAPVQQLCKICGGIHYWGMHCSMIMNPQN